MARKVTLQTIAEHLGVSRTTVSNAYNRPDQLAPELRERVLATAAQLGYTGPDPAARRLRSGGREAIGLLFTESLAYAFVDPGAVLFLQGFARAAEEAGTAMLILPGFAPPRRGGEDRVAVREAVVSGFCAYSLPVDDPDLAAAIERRLPLVIVDEPRTGEHTFVGIDDRAGARLAAAHVAALGHRRIGAVSFRTTDDNYVGPLTPEREAAATYPVTAARLAGWRDGLEAAGIPWADVVKEERVLNAREDGAAGLRALLARDPGITAVLCSTDQLALGVMAAAADAGRPELSLVGFDDIPAAEARDLTTVRQPLLEKGLTAGRLLLDPPEDPAVREIILPVELVPRGSTRPAA
ncbi:MAG TPA: LacI family DNA-binding transcriptional regulator [Solirubrobacteraceae bacterium]|nr:LacI family DNA-binding transcriptional regulator [Solirubrobacteraceae bacterium]